MRKLEVECSIEEYKFLISSMAYAQAVLLGLSSSVDALEDDSKVSSTAIENLDKAMKIVARNVIFDSADAKKKEKT